MRSACIYMRAFIIITLRGAALVICRRVYLRSMFRYATLAMLRAYLILVAMLLPAAMALEKKDMPPPNPLEDELMEEQDVDYLQQVGD